MEAPKRRIIYVKTPEQARIAEKKFPGAEIIIEGPKK